LKLSCFLLAASSLLASGATAAATRHDVGGGDICHPIGVSQSDPALARVSRDGRLIAPELRTHYSRVMQACFVLQSAEGLARSPAMRRIWPRETDHLFGEDGTSLLGAFDGWKDMVPGSCWLGDKVCHSKEQWDELIRPYMKE